MTSVVVEWVKKKDGREMWWGSDRHDEQQQQLWRRVYAWVVTLGGRPARRSIMDSLMTPSLTRLGRRWLDANYDNIPVVRVCMCVCVTLRPACVWGGGEVAQHACRTAPGVDHQCAISTFCHAIGFIVHHLSNCFVWQQARSVPADTHAQTASNRVARPLSSR